MDELWEQINQRDGLIFMIGGDWCVHGKSQEYQVGVHLRQSISDARVFVRELYFSLSSRVMYQSGRCAHVQLRSMRKSTRNRDNVRV